MANAIEDKTKRYLVNDILTFIWSNYLSGVEDSIALIKILTSVNPIIDVSDAMELRIHLFPAAWA